MFDAFKRVGSLIWAAISGFEKHNVGRMAAAIAFNGILSIAPLGVIIVTAAGSIYGRDAAEGLIVDRLRDTLGEQPASALQGILESAYVSAATIPATILAFLVLIFGAARLVGALRGALKNIWEVEGRATGIKGFLLGKLVDTVAVFVLAGFLLATILAQTAVNTVTRYFADWLPFPGALLQISSVVFSLVVAMVVFTIVFRWLPNLDLHWKDVAFGGAVTAVLFTIGNYVLGIYLGRTSPGSVFGAAGAFVVIMLWMNYSALMVLFGVELTRARWERKYGPRPNGPVREEKRLSDA